MHRGAPMLAQRPAAARYGDSINRPSRPHFLRLLQLRGGPAPACICRADRKVSPSAAIRATTNEDAQAIPGAAGPRSTAACGASHENGPEYGAAAGSTRPGLGHETARRTPKLPRRGGAGRSARPPAALIGWASPAARAHWPCRRALASGRRGTPGKSAGVKPCQPSAQSSKSGSSAAPVPSRPATRLHRLRAAASCAARSRRPAALAAHTFSWTDLAGDGPSRGPSPWLSRARRARTVADRAFVRGASGTWPRAVCASGSACAAGASFVCSGWSWSRVIACRC